MNNRSVEIIVIEALAGQLEGYKEALKEANIVIEEKCEVANRLKKELDQLNIKFAPHRTEAYEAVMETFDETVKQCVHEFEYGVSIDEIPNRTPCSNTIMGCNNFGASEVDELG